MCNDVLDLFDIRNNIHIGNNGGRWPLLRLAGLELAVGMEDEAIQMKAADLFLPLAFLSSFDAFFRFLIAFLLPKHQSLPHSIIHR